MSGLSSTNVRIMQAYADKFKRNLNKALEEFESDMQKRCTHTEDNGRSSLVRIGALSTEGRCGVCGACVSLPEENSAHKTWLNRK